MFLVFALVALVYSSVGFGGGSTYTALLILSGLDFTQVPFIALSCNLLVVSLGAWQFAKYEHVQLARVTPWIVWSVPAALLGGYLTVGEALFSLLLGLALAVSGVQLLRPVQPSQASNLPVWLLAPISTLLGLLAGITGIGGGIFLAPVLYAMNYASGKTIAGLCAVFIWVNSAAGLTGQWIKLESSQPLVQTFSEHVLLFPAVMVGGLAGAWLGANKFNGLWVRRLTAVLVLYVGVRLLVRFVGLI